GPEAEAMRRRGVRPGRQELARQIELLAASERSTVLLSGESGTGKGWVARVIHNLSPRSDGPFVEVNCAGLSATFLDSELFGHEKGAYTDAKERKVGLFELADHGTIFLDEIGELTPDLQPKLLKVLETKKFRRLGGTRELSVDVRLIAATNRDLVREVDDPGARAGDDRRRAIAARSAATRLDRPALHGAIAVGGRAAAYRAHPAASQREPHQGRAGAGDFARDPDQQNQSLQPEHLR